MNNKPALSVKFPLMRRFNRILISVLTITIFVGVIIVPFELEAGNASKINNMFDGIWWAVSTVTTVGYGDLVPVTVVGRLLGMLLQVAGVVMFGSMIGIVTTYFNRLQDEYHWMRIQEKLDRTEDELGAVKSKLDFLIKNSEKSQSKPTRWGL